MDDIHLKIAPSILSSDFSRLGEQVAEAAEGGADYMHIDVMDGHFVPNITIGAPVVRDIRRWTKIPLDVHLMITEPERFVTQFAEVGSDIITVQLEACLHPHRVIQQIRDAGAKAGMAINPGTSISAIEELLPSLDQILIMTVNPGFGGQTFIESMVDKIRRLRKLLDTDGFCVDIQVDGGINVTTAATVVDAGARVLVAGSAVFEREVSVATAIADIRRAALIS